jgi:hypothetical protein
MTINPHLDVEGIWFMTQTHWQSWGNGHKTADPPSTGLRAYGGMTQNMGHAGKVSNC